MKNFQIKKAQPQDIDHIYQFILDIAAYEKLSNQVVAKKEMIFQALFGKKPCAEAVLGLLKNIPIGFAIFFQNFSTFTGSPGLYLEDLYINPDYRGQGFGQQFLDYLANIAKQRGYARMEWSVLNWNTPALDFYQKIGAESMDDWLVYRLDQAGIENLATT